MMTQAFYTGLSGLVTSQNAIDVTADNLANINTVGYRASTIEFASLFEDSLHSTGDINPISNTIGVGSRVQATSFSQESGSFKLTERSTDIAINGDGWFGVQHGDNTQFTRAGNFLFDVNNDLVTTDGLYVLGTMGGNIEGNSLSSVIDSISLADVDKQEQLRFPKTLNYPAEPTTSAVFSGNIGVEDTTFVMSAGVIDANGDKNHLELSFTKNENQPKTGSLWDITAVTKTLDGETIYDTQTGTISFDAEGGLISNSLTNIDNNGSTINIDLGEGFGGMVSINTSATSSSSIVDGTIGGELAGYDININAEVIATFTNGMQSSVGKIALYHFQNDKGLERTGASNFIQTSNSGEPIFIQDKNGKNILGADISNFKLESSNVKMEASLTELIILQRSFDANSKSVSTADEMIQKAINMSAS